MGRIVSIVLCLCLCGCGGGGDDEWVENRPKTVPVTATVTIGGSPLSDASVTFSPVSAEGPGASGRTGKDGKLTLTTYKPGDGVVPGEYRVTVIKVHEPDHEFIEDPDDPNYGTEEEVEEEEEPVAVSLIPEKYGNADDSGLLADVTESGENDFTFKLER